jgi:anti-anti-sigma factor
MVVSIAEGCELALSGRMDASSATEMREALHSAIDSGDGDLVVDVSGVDMVDAIGLGVLLGAHRRAGQAGRRVVLRDASPRLLRVLRLARLHRVFALEPGAA